MLRPNQIEPVQSRFDGHSPFQDEAGLKELLNLTVGFVRRQYLIVIAGVIFAVGIGLLYLHFTPPTFTAHAQIMADNRKGQFLRSQSVLTDAPVDRAQLESQLQILKSESIATAVINDLHLTEDPEFIKPSAKPRSKTELMRDVVAAFDSKLEAKTVGMSYVIDISFQSTNPDKAAQIANAVANLYISEEQQAQLRTNQVVGDWLQDRLAGIREQVSAADRSVIEFAKDHNIVSANGRLIDDQRLAELNSQLVAARSRTSEALARLFRIRAVNVKDKIGEPTDATVTDALHDPIITNLRQKQLELNNREAEWAARYGANHQAVVRLREQQRETRDSIHAELQRLAESYKSDYAIARQHENEIQKELASTVSQLHLTNKDQIKFSELKSSAKSYHDIYDNFLRKYTELVQQQSFPISQSRVISRASTPLSKSHPKTHLILAFSFLGGLCFGAGVGILRELMDRVFRTRDQVETELQAPCIAMIPLMEDTARQKFSTNKKSISTRPEPRTIVRDSGLYWSLADLPDSRFAEGIRSIKLAVDAVDLGRTEGPNKIIGFTSSLPNEGKSTIAAAIAQLSAQIGDKVLVVDCDLRNPALSRAFTKNSGPGLVEVISGRRSLDDVIWREPATNFAFLPVGDNFKLSHTSEILASNMTKKLFDQLRQRYDYVIADLPPLAPIVDVRATTRFIDSYFVVIEWGETKIDVVQHALSAAPAVYDNLGGVILNKINMKSLKRYEINRKHYYYNKYYGRYGYTH